ncbi:MAG: ABC transporter permease [Acidimicrobiia bacterium]|nr:ABC transporter permease [Acidimicrobiia bacterium]
MTTLTQTATHIGIITRRNVLRNIRLPQLLLFSTVQPVMFLLLFNYVFGGSIAQAIPPVFGNYINFLLPGIIIQNVVFGATATSVGLTEDLQAGVIDRFRSLPMARSAVLAGRTFADIWRSGFVITLMTAVAYLIGFRPLNGFFSLVLAVALALGFGYSMSWVMAWIGLKVKTPEAAQSAGFLPVFPLTFASSVFVPTSSMPSWLATFAENQPVSVLANTARALILGDAYIQSDPSLVASGATTGSLVLLSLAWIVGIVVVAAPLAVRSYRKTAE